MFRKAFELCIKTRDFTFFCYSLERLRKLLCNVNQTREAQKILERSKMYFSKIPIKQRYRYFYNHAFFMFMQKFYDDAVKGFTRVVETMPADLRLDVESQCYSNLADAMYSRLKAETKDSASQLSNDDGVNKARSECIAAIEKHYLHALHLIRKYAESNSVLQTIKFLAVRLCNFYLNTNQGDKADRLNQWYQYIVIFPESLIKKI